MPQGVEGKVPDVSIFQQAVVVILESFLLKVVTEFVGDDLSASGMLSNTLGFTLSMPVGRAKIRLDMFSNSYGLTKTNNKFYLSGCYTDGVYAQ